MPIAAITKAEHHIDHPELIMPLPSDQKLAKLRILTRRAEAEEKRCEEALYEARQARGRLQVEFYKRVEELGYCPVCELPKAECKGHPFAADSFDRTNSLTDANWASDWRWQRPKGE